MADLFWVLAVTCLAAFTLHWCVTRPGPSGPAVAPPSPARTSAAGPEDTLTPAETIALASLATRYAHADPRAGRMLADYLRTRAPGVSDADLMRCVLALATMVRWFNREHLTATDALAGYLHALSLSALDLTQWYRDEVPR